jgi:hypothetical protein
VTQEPAQLASQTHCPHVGDSVSVSQTSPPPQPLPQATSQMHSPQVGDSVSVSQTSPGSPQPLPQATSHSQAPSTQISVSGQTPVGLSALHGSGSHVPSTQI